MYLRLCTPLRGQPAHTHTLTCPYCLTIPLHTPVCTHKPPNPCIALHTYEGPCEQATSAHTVWQHVSAHANLFIYGLLMVCSCCLLCLLYMLCCLCTRTRKHSPAPGPAPLRRDLACPRVPSMKHRSAPKEKCS